MIMITQERLKQLLNYDPVTGVFTWVAKKTGKGSNTIVVGAEAGTIGFEGYRVIGIDRRYYKAHRLAFLFMIGRFPIDGTDHINRDRLDNRWANLREANRSQNMMNRVSTRKTIGLRGTTWDKRHKKWRAQIRKDKKTICLGYFNSIEEAHQIYLSAAQQRFGEFVYQE